MGYVRFNNQGYVYSDIDEDDLFSEDNYHFQLFNFVATDFSSFPKLLNDYFQNRIDEYTLEFKGEKHSEPELFQIRHVLKSSHKYFEFEAGQVICQAIAEYFNDMLENFLYMHQELAYTFFNKSRYSELLLSLLPNCECDSSYSFDISEYYNKYIEHHTVPPFNMLPTTRIDLKNCGFRNLIISQRHISNMLYYLLDKDDAELSSLDSMRRMWIFSNIYDVTKTAKKIFHKFKTPKQEVSIDDFLSFKDYTNEVTLGELKKYNIMNGDRIPQDLQNLLSETINQCKTVNDFYVFDGYEVNSIYDLLYLEIIHMYENGEMIAKCKNCGKYFSTKSRKVVYCDRMTDKGKTCAEVGPTLAYLEKQRADKVLQMYTRAYKRNFARCTNGKMDKAKFKEWHNKATEKLLQARNGKLSPEEFELWLKEQ